MLASRPRLVPYTPAHLHPALCWLASLTASLRPHASRAAHSGPVHLSLAFLSASSRYARCHPGLSYAARATHIDLPCSAPPAHARQPARVLHAACTSYSCSFTARSSACYRPAHSSHPVHWPVPSHTVGSHPACSHPHPLLPNLAPRAGYSHLALRPSTSLATNSRPDVALHVPLCRLTPYTPIHSHPACDLCPARRPLS